MDTTRIKVKIGQHEFEAEGPTEVVREQFGDFKKLIADLPGLAASEKAVTSHPERRGASIDGEIRYDSICRVQDRVVSLTVKPESETTAAMLVMLGQRAFRDNETVTASELADGLEQSGYRIARLDKVMQPLTDDGSVVRIGARKGTRYRFTNQGLAKAQAAAREAIGQVS